MMYEIYIGAVLMESDGLQTRKSNNQMQTIAGALTICSKENKIRLAVPLSSQVNKW